MSQQKYVSFGISESCWNNDDFPHLGEDMYLNQCFREMGKTGYSGCELGNTFPRDPQEIKERIGRSPIRIASGSFSCFFTLPDRFQETIDNFKKYMEFLKQMGADVIVVCESGSSIYKLDKPILGEKPVMTEETWQKLVEGLHIIGELARQNDMLLVYHHHIGTVIQTPEEIESLMSRTDPNLVSLVIDTGDILLAGGDSVEMIEKHADRIKHVHLKDIRSEILEETKQNNYSFETAVERGIFTTPGNGWIDFRPIFEALKAHDYSGWIIVVAPQKCWSATPFYYAWTSRDYLRQHYEKRPWLSSFGSF